MRRYTAAGKVLRIASLDARCNAVVDFPLPLKMYRDALAAAPPLRIQWADDRRKLGRAPSSQLSRVPQMAVNASRI